MDRHSVQSALRHGCYRNSRLATVPLAFSVALHRFLGTWNLHVDAFIALSEFQKNLMGRAGLPQEKIHVKPNFYPGNPVVVPWFERKPYVIFAGRLGVEKGIETLLQAWRLWGDEAPELRLAGDGELRQKFERVAFGLPVRFLGQIPFGKVQEQVGGARLLVLPSECFEGFPMAVREALALGTPAAVSDLGPLPEIIKDQVSGIVFRAANPESLLHKVREAWESPGALERMGSESRRQFEKKYTASHNYQMLMGIYEVALQSMGRRLKAM
jgi:glycosyltransferase involved in cell wall biosynthesis